VRKLVIFALIRLAIFMEIVEKERNVMMTVIPVINVIYYAKINIKTV
jgi:hypothetical protein